MVNIFSAGSSSVTPEESARIRKSHEEAMKQWRKRKRLVCALVLCHPVILNEVLAL